MLAMSMKLAGNSKLALVRVKNPNTENNNRTDEPNPPSLLFYKICLGIIVFGIIPAFVYSLIQKAPQEDKPRRSTKSRKKTSFVKHK